MCPTTARRRQYSDSGLGEVGEWRWWWWWRNLVRISFHPSPFEPIGRPETSALTIYPQNRLSNHYQWVVFLVIMVVAIVGIWVGACVWRKRYMRKRDRQYALGTNLAHATESGRVVPNDSNQGSIHVPAAGMFQPAPIESAGIYGEKPKGKKKLFGRNRS